MIDEDFYFEESNPKKVFLICLLILFLIGVGFGAYKYYDKQTNIRLKTVEIELGDKVPSDISHYIKSGKYDGYSIDISNVHVNEEENTDSVGEYSYTVKKDKNILKGKIIVKDTTPPEVELQDLTVGLNEDYDINDFLVSCNDLSEVCHVYYANSKDEEYVKEEGTYEISLKIKDKYNNEITKKVNLIVNKDASLKELKASDTTVTNIYPIDDQWDNTYTVKFKKGLAEKDDELEEALLELVNIDFDSKYEDKIKEQTLLIIYNKYNFALGLSIKLEFENGKVIYVSENAITKEE